MECRTPATADRPDERRRETTDTAAPTAPVPTAPTASAGGVHAPELSPARLRAVLLVLAAACGMTVANLYYAQPLLAPIAADFHVSQGSTTLVVTLTQLGYAAGLLFLLPLGDLLENRRLATRTLLVTAASLFAAGLSPDFGAFLVLAVVVGSASVVAQMLVPFAAHLSSEQDRGRAVGTVMSGLLLGILLARTVASLVAAAWGWRTIYLISGVLMLALMAALRRTLPELRPAHRSGYGTLMRSLAHLVRDEPALRRRAVSQALMFGAFSCFWTAVSFELIRRHHMGQIGIAVFALVGAGGAAAAPIAGRLGDRGLGRAGSGVALVLAVVSLLLADLGAGSVLLLAVAGVLLDLAVQSHQVLSQREIYGLRADARARINTVYMTTVFIGGAAASAVAGVVDETAGWTGVTLLAAGLALVGFAIWGGSTVRAVRAEARR